MHALGADKYGSLGLKPPFDRCLPPTKDGAARVAETIEVAGLKTTVGRMI